jgi:hypothetical protein
MMYIGMRSLQADTEAWSDVRKANVQDKKISFNNEPLTYAISRTEYPSCIKPSHEKRKPTELELRSATQAVFSPSPFEISEENSLAANTAPLYILSKAGKN